jgi:hypothetical protein
MRRLASTIEGLWGAATRAPWPLIAATLASCAVSDGSELPTPPSALPDQQVISASDATPLGVELAFVAATGEGCPAGTWSSELTPDGSTFLIRFRRFMPTIAADVTREASACDLAIVTSSAKGRSYKVEKLVYRGYAYLEPGVTATVTTMYHFQTDRARAEQLRTTFEGPYDDVYEVEAPALEELWSPCSQTPTNTLNVQVHVELRNGVPARDGTFELNDGFTLQLAWRRCGDSD